MTKPASGLATVICYERIRAKNSLACREACDIFHELCAAQVAGESFHAAWCVLQMKKGPELLGMGRYMALGIQMVIVTAVIAGIGYWLDKKTGKEPLFLIVFFFLGALGGMAVVWRAFHDEGPKRP